MGNPQHLTVSMGCPQLGIYRTIVMLSCPLKVTLQVILVKVLKQSLSPLQCLVINTILMLCRSEFLTVSCDETMRD